MLLWHKTASALIEAPHNSLITRYPLHLHAFRLCAALSLGLLFNFRGIIRPRDTFPLLRNHLHSLTRFKNRYQVVHTSKMGKKTKYVPLNLSALEPISSSRAPEKYPNARLQPAQSRHEYAAVSHLQADSSSSCGGRSRTDSLVREDTTPSSEDGENTSLPYLAPVPPYTRIKQTIVKEDVLTCWIDGRHQTGLKSGLEPISPQSSTPDIYHGRGFNVNTARGNSAISNEEPANGNSRKAAISHIKKAFNARPRHLELAECPTKPSLPLGNDSPTQIVPLQGAPLYPRRQAQGSPIVGKVYFLPDGRHFLNSILWTLKRDQGFYNHPAIIVAVEGKFVQFYAMTKVPPHAIRELKMCLRVGSTSLDQGADVLSLANSSSRMQMETWVNLEQLYTIEWHNLDDWALNVRVASRQLSKIKQRVTELEAQQNRYLYKPLLRDLSAIQPGTVLMLPNNNKASTLGAPIIVVENAYPRFRFLRIKLQAENPNFNPEAKKKCGSPRYMCLQLSKHPRIGHDGTPVMLLEPWSPDMRELSYVEVFVQADTGNITDCKTWCWPPVQVRQQSMDILRGYMHKLGNSFEWMAKGSPMSSRPSSSASSTYSPYISSGWNMGMATRPVSQGMSHGTVDAGPPFHMSHNSFSGGGLARSLATPPYTPAGHDVSVGVGDEKARRDEAGNHIVSQGIDMP